MNKRTMRIAAIIACCFGMALALCGCDALGVSITSQGIQANSNVLLIGIIVIVILVVFIQRFMER